MPVILASAALSLSDIPWNGPVGEWMTLAVIVDHVAYSFSQPKGLWKSLDTCVSDFLLFSRLSITDWLNEFVIYLDTKLFNHIAAGIHSCLISSSLKNIPQNDQIYCHACSCYIVIKSLSVVVLTDVGLIILDFFCFFYFIRPLKNYLPLLSVSSTELEKDTGQGLTVLESQFYFVGIKMWILLLIWFSLSSFKVRFVFVFRNAGIWVEQNGPFVDIKICSILF